MLTDETMRFLLRVLREKIQEDRAAIEALEWKARMAPVSRQVAEQLIVTHREEIEKTERAIQELHRAGWRSED